MPKHVAIILDGNNRYSKARGLRGGEGFEVLLKKSLKEAVRVSVDWGIEILTLFYFSCDNWNRGMVISKTHFCIWRCLLQSAVLAVILFNDLCNVSFYAVDRTERFPETLQKLVGMKVVVAAGYGGRRDILQATQRIAQLVANKELSIDEINLEVFESHLMTNHMHPSSVDLTMRTSGEHRISNFLLWQMAWTEFVFLNETWPEFRRDSMKNALISYQSRDRRLGLRKTKF
ncbi:protein MpCPT7 [Marchantia polymorpha subsp. ruderalis]